MSVTIGVPQRSVLETLLFVKHMNDMDVEGTSSKFTDDMETGGYQCVDNC